MIVREYSTYTRVLLAELERRYRIAFMFVYKIIVYVNSLVPRPKSPRGERFSLVPRPDHARARKGSGDIGADSWFCKLSNHVIVCICFYWRTCGHVMVRTTKKTLQCPQTLFLVRGWGLGTRLGKVW